jgi:hypothetical protein
MMLVNASYGVDVWVGAKAVGARAFAPGLDGPAAVVPWIDTRRRRGIRAA